MRLLAGALVLLIAIQGKDEKPVRLPENYAHPFLAFKIYLPAKWVRGQNRDKVNCSFYGPKDQMFVPRLDLIVERTKDDVATIVGKFKAAFEKQYPKVKFIRDGALGGRSGEGYVFVAEVDSDGIPTHSAWGFFVSGDRAYTMSFAVSKAWSDKYIPFVEAAMKSLRIFDEPKASLEQKQEFEKEFNAATAANRKSDFGPAESGFKRCTELLPEWPETHGALGIVHMKKKNYAGAEDALRRAVELDPDDPAWNFNLGACLLQQSKYDGAIKHLEKASTLDPSEPALTNLGAAYLAKDQTDKAIETLLKAVKADPESATAHYNLGLAYEKASKMRDAEREFRETLKIDNKHEPAREALKRVLKK